MAVLSGRTGGGLEGYYNLHNPQRIVLYRRLMFGITFAPEKYQKIIFDVLAGCSGVANIGDDLIIYGTDLAEHDSNLRKVLTRLEEQGLTFNGDKCQFRLPGLTFFGHELSARGIAPTEEKIAAVVNARPPQNVSEVRSFVQLVQYSARFIPDFAQVAEPLRRLLRKGEPFVWGPEEGDALHKLKELMTGIKGTRGVEKADQGVENATPK